MDLTTLRLEVRERLGELEADFFTDVEVDRAINEAIQRFCTEERWDWLMTEGTSTIAEGDSDVDLPLNVSPSRLFTVSVSGGSLGTTGGRSLERVTPAEGVRLRHIWDGRGSSPRWYYVVSAFSDSQGTQWTARFGPVSDGDYDVDFLYLAVPDELSSGSDEPGVPIEYQEAIPAWAAGKLFLKEMSISQKAQEQFSLYAKVLNQARTEQFAEGQDEVTAWGRSQPQARYDYDGREYTRSRIPPQLGP